MNTFTIDKVHNREFHLDNILHVLRITKNLMIVSQFTNNYSVLIKFHSDCYFMKEKCMGWKLLQGEVNQDLYSFKISLDKRRHGVTF